MSDAFSKGELRRRQRRIADEDRKRAAKACHRCKKRKNKCIETTAGVCQRCQDGGHHCSFIDGQDEAVGGIRTPAGASQDIDMVNSILHDPGTKRGIDSGITRASQVRPDSVANDLAMTPSDSYGWAGFLVRLREAFYLDPQRTANDNATDAYLAQNNVVPSQEARARVRAAFARFPPEPVARFLVNVCIEHGTDCFFYFDQSRFVVELSDLYNNQHSRLRENPSFVCLALSVFALGSQWTTLAKPGDGTSTPSFRDGDPGRLFYDQVRALVGDLVDVMSTTAVQALFVLSVYLMPASAIGAAYVYMGLALRKAVSIDLHREVTDPAIPDVEREARRRLWWAIYALERTLTVKLNMPPSIQSSEISVVLPSACNRIDSRQKFDNLPLQLANAQLVMILDDLTEKPYMTLERRTAFESRLKQWKRSLPPTLKPGNISGQSSYYRATTHIHLNYRFAWIAMGKVSVVTLARARLSSALRPDQGPTSVDPDILSLALSCIRSAKKMVALFEDLHRTGNITGFSFTDFQGCSIATIVLLVAGLISGQHDSSTMAAAGLGYLKLMAGKNVTALRGVHFVEAVQSIVAEAKAEIAANPTPTVQVASRVTRPDTLEYNQWAQWLSSTIPNDPGTDIQRGHTEVPRGGSASLQPDERAGLSVRSTPSSISGFPPFDQVGTAAAADQPPRDATTSHNLFGAHGPPGGYDPALNANSTAITDFEYAFEDDYDYLMGLTGLGVLDFAEQIDFGFDFRST